MSYDKKEISEMLESMEYTINQHNEDIRQVREYIKNKIETEKLAIRKSFKLVITHADNNSYIISNETKDGSKYFAEFTTLEDANHYLDTSFVKIRNQEDGNLYVKRKGEK